MSNDGMELAKSFTYGIRPSVFDSWYRQVPTHTEKPTNTGLSAEMKENFASTEMIAAFTAMALVAGAYSTYKNIVGSKKQPVIKVG